MARVIYLTSYKRNGISYPLGGSGNFPVTIDANLCVTPEEDDIVFQNKMKILKEEISVAAKRAFQNIISLKDSSQIMSLSSSNSPSVPLLYYNE